MKLIIENLILFSAILLAVFAGIFGYAPGAGAMAFSLDILMRQRHRAFAVDNDICYNGG